MQSGRSHGRLAKKLCHIGIVILIPVLLAGFGASWILQSGRDVQEKIEQQGRAVRISNDAQMLGDLLLDEIATLRANSNSMAYSYAQFPESFQISAESRILHWIALERSEKGFQVRASIGSLVWKHSPDFEDSYIKAVQETVQKDSDQRDSEIRKHLSVVGFYVLPISEQTLKGEHWVSLIFQSPLSADSVQVVLIDPMQALPLFRKWASHSNGGQSRSYLVGPGGVVLAHSQPNWVFTRVNALPLYQDQLKKVIAGKVVSGFGEFVGLDHQSVEVGYFRVGFLPWVVVVEEVQLSSLVPVWKPLWVEGTLFLLIFLAGVILGCAYYLNSKLVRVVTLSVNPETLRDFEQSPPKPVIQSAHQGKEFFESNELLIMDPIKDKGH